MDPERIVIPSQARGPQVVETFTSLFFLTSVIIDKRFDRGRANYFDASSSRSACPSAACRSALNLAPPEVR